MRAGQQTPHAGTCRLSWVNAGQLQVHDSIQVTARHQLTPDLEVSALQWLTTPRQRRRIAVAPERPKTGPATSDCQSLPHALDPTTCFRAVPDTYLNLLHLHHQRS